jgi:drug/metabolite transporter (DMT)-like permease
VDAFNLAIVLLSALLHAGWSITIKGSRNSLVFNLLQTLAAAAIGLSLLATVTVAQLPSRLWPVLAATGIAHGLYLYWLSRALSLADISLVYPIARSTPAFLPLAAVPLLDETISPTGAIGIATVVAGMWLVNLQKGIHWRSLARPGVLFAYLTLASTVAYGLLDKQAMVLLEDSGWTSVVPRPIFYFFMLYLACSVVYVPLALRRLDRATLAAVARAEWPRALGALFVSFASYTLILQALRAAPVSYVVAVRQSSVFFVLALSVALLGERPSRMRVLGAAVTVAGVALVSVAR